MKLSRRPMMPIVPAVALAGSMLSVPMAGAQSSELGSLSPEAVQGSVFGQECSVTTTATRTGEKEPGYGDVSDRTGDVEKKNAAYFRIDGWGSANGQSVRMAFASAKELKNVTITLTLDEALEGVATNNPQPATGIAVGDMSGEGGEKIENVTQEIEGNKVTLTIPSVPARGSLGHTYHSTTPMPDEGVSITHSATLSGEGLAEAGFCEDAPGVLGSLDNPDLGSLAVGGSLALAAAITVGGGAWAVQNGMVELPQ